MKSGNAIAKLIQLSGGALGGQVELPQFEPFVYQNLQALVTPCNGYLCFYSALHVFPWCQTAPGGVGADWNSAGLWRSVYGNLIPAGIVFFAEDIFGGQFGLFEGKVVSFDPDTAITAVVCDSVEEWAGLVLADPELLSGYPLAEQWQRCNGPIPLGHRLVPQTPFFAGGEYTLDNLVVVDSVFGMRARAGVARETNGVADGTKIKIKFENG